MNTPAVSYNSRSVGEQGKLAYAIETIWWLVGFLTGTATALLMPPARPPHLRFVRQQATGALTYPIIMLCVGTAIIAFLLTYVVPQVATIFEQQHAALPASTKLLIRTSGFFNSHLLAFALLLLATIAGVGGTLATPPGNRLYHYYLDEVVRPHRREIITVLEPVMTLAMAAVIVFMMLAVLMPIFQLNQLMQ